ncbi:MAG: tetratricopeptide repeat protein, partial [Acidobacteriia bacterium]|nr:tetratricopeptide repeat protein [Terriglobia bacterium]
MALDLDKTRKNAERLLKQGRVQAALEEYQRLAEEAPRDLPLLNLVGDLLSRIGRHRDALPYYDRIAEEYSRSGFFLKAIAILKKVLRNEPDRPDVLLRVGDLYLKQKLPGEARGYLLHAADRFVAARGFREAHEVYRKLVAAEPDDPLHRLRLAETMAAGGDAAGAAGSLVEVAETARGAGRLGEAEKIYRRALDLLPGRPEALSGLARCLGAQGRAAEAVALLARALEARPEASVAVVLVALEGQAGRPAEALRLLTGRFADAMPAEAFESVVRSFAERGESAIAWAALDPLVARWTRDAPERVVALLERLAGVEPDGHLPALERLLDLRGRHADGAGMVATLVAMERAYRSRSMHAEAERIAERLRGLAPAVAQAAGLPAEESGAGVAAAEPAPVQAPAPPAADPAGASAAPIPPEYEAPAVPLGPAEHESVAGRLTQAEIFEKYGLFEQAIEQLKEVTRRYPGLANAQQ